MWVIGVQNDEFNYPVETAGLEKAAQAALRAANYEAQAALTIVLTDDEHVRALNARYRGIDAPTDVLSFPAEPLPFSDEGETPYLGDLIIGYPYALAQAEREHQDITHNLMLLAVHGTLHLLGYDHDTPENRAEMWACQEIALRALGIAPEIVPPLEDEAYGSPT